jgi:predicted transcriptional regulator of viral defense system
MEKLIKIFKQNKGYLSSSELTGRTMRYQLQKMIDDGSVSKLKRGVYCLNEELSKRQMIDTERIIPQSVLCLFSAWSHYNLSLSIPNSYYLAIEKSRKVSIPEFPLINIVYLKKEYFELGIIEKEIEDIKVKIYDIEKSVCDAVKYRNKIGMEITSEVIRNYLANKKRNINKLVEYAKKMRIYNTLKMYIEVQL